MWRWFLRPILFRLDAERAHHLAMGVFAAACAIPGVRALIALWMRVDDAALRTRVLGLEFPSPIGLAAGFDKDARWADALAALGFGFLEVGTVTAEAQPGNPRPRLFRLVPDRALLNRFGFNNAGAAAAARRLQRRRCTIPVGVNIGKTKRVPNEEAVADYVASFDAVAPVADYVVVNVSSPNTPGLRALQDRDALAGILRALQARNDALPARRPLLVKIAPDLTEAQIDEVIALALDLKIDGIVATNTTVSREGLVTPGVEALGPGGISGAPIARRAREVVRYIHEKSNGRLVVVGAGGVASADEARALIEAGAALVQVYTGFVYGGPTFVRTLTRGLARLVSSKLLTLH